MNAKKKDTLAIIILVGSAWGLAEATLGYLAHLYFEGYPGLPGFLLFPISFYFIYKTYGLTGSRWACLGAAVVGAAIKLGDLLLPLPHPIFAINPGLAMILEAAAVAAFLPAIGRARAVPRFVLVLAAVLAYKIAFIAFQGGFLASGFTPASFNLAAKMATIGSPLIAGFFVTESLVNAAIVLAGLTIGRKRSRLDGLYRRAAGSLGPISLFSLAASIELLFKFAR